MGNSLGSYGHYRVYSVKFYWLMERPRRIYASLVGKGLILYITHPHGTGQYLVRAELIPRGPLHSYLQKWTPANREGE